MRPSYFAGHNVFGWDDVLERVLGKLDAQWPILFRCQKIVENTKAFARTFSRRNILLSAKSIDFASYPHILVQRCVCSLAKTYADFISYSITQATDTSNIRLVFVTVKETILHNALKESGIL